MAHFFCAHGNSSNQTFSARFSQLRCCWRCRFVPWNQGDFEKRTLKDGGSRFNKPNRHNSWNKKSIHCQKSWIFLSIFHQDHLYVYQPTSLETFSWWKVNLFFWMGVWWWDHVWEMWDLWRTAGHDALAQLWLDFMPWGWRTCPQAVRSSDRSNHACWWLVAGGGGWKIPKITGKAQPVEGVKGSVSFFLS